MSVRGHALSGPTGSARRSWSTPLPIGRPGQRLSTARRRWVPVRAPATVLYLSVLTGTWWTLQHTDPALAYHLVLEHSTNWHNMTRYPLRALAVSPFWTDESAFPWRAVVEGLLVLIPAEILLGTRRWLLAFAAGHVGATLLTTAYIGYAVDRGLLGAQSVDVPDVGGSYGMYAVAVFAAGCCTDRRVARAAAGALFAYLLAQLLIGRTFTDWGHVAAFSIGYGLLRLTRQATPPTDLLVADPAT